MANVVKGCIAKFQYNNKSRVVTVDKVGVSKSNGKQYFQGYDHNPETLGERTFHVDLCQNLVVETGEPAPKGWDHV